jgi:hypothetical protein
MPHDVSAEEMRRARAVADEAAVAAAAARSDRPVAKNGPTK